MNIYQEKINEVYYQVELIKKSLSEIVYEGSLNGEFSYDDCTEIDKWDVSVKDEIIRVYIHDYPSRLSNAKDLYRKRWLNNMRTALINHPKLPDYDKIFVWVKVYLPIKDWDVDNRDVKPLIDGIRFARIIRDDNIKNMSFGIDGYISDDPHTEVFIIPFIKFQNSIENLTSNLWLE